MATQRLGTLASGRLSDFHDLQRGGCDDGLEDASAGRRTRGASLPFRTRSVIAEGCFRQDLTRFTAVRRRRQFRPARFRWESSTRCSAESDVDSPRRVS